MPFGFIRFLLFLAVAAIVFRTLPARARQPYLFSVSYIFYALWSIPHALLLLCATGVAYLAGNRLAGAREHRDKVLALAVSVVLLLGSLAFFKYVNQVEGILRGTRQLYWLFPVGISYYTFKLISYIVDVFWDNIPAEKDFLSFATCAAFFPQIASGPIHRPAEFLPQLAALELPTSKALVIGVRLIALGLFQKIVIADRLGMIVDPLYASAGEYHGWPLMVGLYCFSIQLYADFSGMTDIAIGSGMLFGLRSPENFDKPFLAQSIKEFWRRWHMTLTSWITDYVFTPLQIALRNYGTLGLTVCLFITMLTLGAWHGARWNYLIFGAIHGVFLTVSALTMQRRNRFFKKHKGWVPFRKIAAPIITFHLVTLSFVFFRAETPAKAFTILHNLLQSQTFPLELQRLFPTPYGIVVLGAAFVLMEIGFVALRFAVDGNESGVSESDYV